MERLTLTSTNSTDIIAKAAQVLSSGGLIIYPTETMYGVGVDATNSEAVTKLLTYKNRPAGKPISVLVSDQKQAASLVDLNDQAKSLYKTFLPGPVTVISTDKGVVDHRLVSEFNTLGIRISSDTTAQNLVNAVKKPITATSANASGKARPYSIDGLLGALSSSQKALIDLVIDAGELPHNEPSTVIDTTTQVQEVLRAGANFHELQKPEVSHSEEETIALAKRYMEKFLHVLPEKTVVFALEGDMGMGKTRFAKGVGEALRVKEMVNSPSYTLMNEYEGEYRGVPVAYTHIDCWRMESDVASELGLETYIHPYSVLVVEWAAPLLSWLEGQADQIVGYRIQIEQTSDDERTLKVGAL